MLTLDRAAGDFLYRQVIDLVMDQIASGALTPGQRLPSLRHMSGRLGVSVPVVRQAYEELERQGRVESRPQSGFYVRSGEDSPLVSRGTCRARRPARVRQRTLLDEVYEGIHRPGVVPFGIANPSMAKPAVKGLNRAMKRVMARTEERALNYAPANGEPGLRRQIAHRYLDLGGAVDPEEIIITHGAQEALALALQAVAREGDIIAVESPTYHGMLEMIESLGMLALEIDTCPEEGVMLDALERALDQHDVRACMFHTSLNNPLGSATTNEHREALVALLEDRDVPLIEDDVYGDLMFDGRRPRPAQFYARRNGVITCSSFSKTVAPGYRIGWIMGGRYDARIRNMKRAFSCSCGLLQQLTLSEYLATGEYDRHLRALLPVLRCNAERMRARVGQHFPGETRVSRPQGGGILWLELPRGVDSDELFRRALDQNISTCPGSIYAPSRRYRNFIRLSFGHPWSDRMEAAMADLGHLVGQMT